MSKSPSIFLAADKATMSDDCIRITYLANRGNHDAGISSVESLRLQVERYLSQHHMPPLDWKLVTNQRAALAVEPESAPPRLLWVEFSSPDQRTRFCEVAQHRFPSTKIIGIGYQRPLPSVALHDFLNLPLESLQVDRLLAEVFASEQGHIVFVGKLGVNLHSRTVFTPAGQHHMTPKTTALLHLFMTRANEVLSRSEIMYKIWQTDYLEDTRTLDVHIRWLREYIEIEPSEPRYLVTVRGRGYCFKPE